MVAFAEQQTEWIINNNLVNKQWVIDDIEGRKNVFFQKSPYPKDQNKLELVEKQGKYKKPDYILYQTGTEKPIAIIEAKRGGGRFKKCNETSMGLCRSVGSTFDFLYKWKR